jgi:predicted transcriptional regulator
MKMYTSQRRIEKQMSKVISFRIDDEDRAILEAYAEEYDATISWAARRAIKEFTTKLTKENKDGEEDNLCAESNGTTCKDGPLSGSDFTQS